MTMHLYPNELLQRHNGPAGKKLARRSMIYSHWPEVSVTPLMLNVPSHHALRQL